MKKQSLKIFFLLALFLMLPEITLAEDPLILANNLVYQGAFRVRTGDFGGPAGYGFSYGGGVIAYNPANNSLFMLGHVQKQWVGEISIPTPLIPNSASDLSNLNYAAVLQNLAEIREGNGNKVGSAGAIADANGVNIGGMLVYNDKLLGTSFTFYPGDTAYLSHWTSGLTLGTTGDFLGNFKVGTVGASFVSGPMAKVPALSQSLLGGPALTGNGSLSVLSRTSYGPAAFSFDPDRVGIDNPAAATPLLYYDQAHQVLGSSVTNPNWNDTTKIAGMAMAEGSRSVLFFGYHGLGQRNYGQLAADPIFADTCRAPDACITGPKGWPICEDMNNCVTGRKGIPYDNGPGCAGAGSDGCYYDPSGMGAKGPHAYPYIYQAWAYDANDLAHVKNSDVIAADRSLNIDSSCATGTVYQPWCVRPYAIWTLPFAVAPTDLFGGAAAYDPTSGRIFIVQPQGDKANLYDKMPLVHVFQVDTGAGAAGAYSIKVTTMLLSGTVVLQNNGADDLTITAASRSTTQASIFSAQLAPQSSYNVTVASQPVGQTCTVLNGSGIIGANADISNIVVACYNISDATSPAAPSGLSVQ